MEWIREMCNEGQEQGPIEQVKSVSKDAYTGDYEARCVDMYKLFVEMADKTSARRQTNNSFFLSINTAIIAAVGYVGFGPEKEVGAEFYVLIAVAGIVLSVLWFCLIQSYKNLNTHKFKVILAIENVLPLRPYGAEWDLAGEGKKPLYYWPFTHIERLIPWVFFAIHLVVFLRACNCI